MRLTCPACAAQYEIEDGLIPEEGRQVQCTACDHRWTALPDDSAPAAPETPPDLPRPSGLSPDVARILREEAQAERERSRASDPMPPARPQPVPETEPEGAGDRQGSAQKPHLSQVGSSPRSATPTAEKPRPRDPQPRPDMPKPQEAGPDPVARPKATRAAMPDAAGRGKPARPDLLAKIKTMDTDPAEGPDGVVTALLAVVALLLFAGLIYVEADAIAARAPALAGPVEAYAQMVDGIDGWLTRQVRGPGTGN